MGQIKATPPHILTSKHRTQGFDCGDVNMDRWLKRNGLRNQGRYTRTYVVCEEGHNEVIAYYSISAGSVEKNRIKKKYATDAPNQIPVMLLARLAVDARFQGNGIARNLIREALRLTYEVSKVIGVRALLVHALNEEVKSLYEKFGFVNSHLDEPLTLMVSVKEIEFRLA